MRPQSMFSTLVLHCMYLAYRMLELTQFANTSGPSLHFKTYVILHLHWLIWIHVFVSCISHIQPPNISYFSINTGLLLELKEDDGVCNTYSRYGSTCAELSNTKSCIALLKSSDRSLGLNTGFLKSAHKHVHFFGGLFFNILFSTFGMIMQ